MSKELVSEDEPFPADTAQYSSVLSEPTRVSLTPIQASPENKIQWPDVSSMCPTHSVSSYIAQSHGNYSGERGVCPLFFHSLSTVSQRKIQSTSKRSPIQAGREQQTFTLAVTIFIHSVPERSEFCPENVGDSYRHPRHCCFRVLIVYEHINEDLMSWYLVALRSVLLTG